MIRPPMSELQKLAFRQLFEIADAQGLTAEWSPARELEVQFTDSEDLAVMVASLIEVEGTWPGLLTVLQSDPVVRFEAAAPMVQISLGTWARDLLGEGFFHGTI